MKLPTSVGFLTAASFILSCAPPADLPDPGAFSAELVRLEGAPEHAHPPARLRVLVAELNLGVDLASEERAYDAERVERFAEHAVAYQPDLFAVLDAPFAGPFVREADPAEDLAVAVDRYYRAELRTSTPRRHRELPVGPASGGTLILSEYPLEPTGFETPTARPLAPMYLPPHSAELVLEAGPTTVRVIVRDGTGLTGGSEAASTESGPVLLIGRGGGECGGLVGEGLNPICLTPPDGWELLRHEIVADYAGLGLRAIKAEYRVASAPVASD